MREKDIPNLIVGHTGSDHARIWVRGSDKGPVAFLSYKSEGGQATELTMLLPLRPVLSRRTIVACAARSRLRTWSRAPRSMYRPEPIN